MNWRMRSLPCFRSHRPEGETADRRLIFVTGAIFGTDCDGRVMLAEAMVAEHPKKGARPWRPAAEWAGWTIDQLRYRARGGRHAAPEPTTRRRGRARRS